MINHSSFDKAILGLNNCSDERAVPVYWLSQSNHATWLFKDGFSLEEQWLIAPILSSLGSSLNWNK